MDKEQHLSQQKIEENTSSVYRWCNTATWIEYLLLWTSRASIFRVSIRILCFSHTMNNNAGTWIPAIPFLYGLMLNHEWRQALRTAQSVLGHTLNWRSAGHRQKEFSAAAPTAVLLVPEFTIALLATKMQLNASNAGFRKRFSYSECWQLCIR